jgi:hypothetical protein
MRRLVPALLGLAMAAPAAALAQSNDCRDCNTGYVVQPTQMPNGFRPPRLCADCYKKYKQTGVWPGPNPPPGMVAAAPGPNYAPQYAPQMAGSYAPGYAMAGEAASPFEPTPVGVMRTNYRANAGMSPNPAMMANPTGAGMAPGYAMSGMMPQQGPIAPAYGPESTLLAGPSSGHRNMFATLMGWNWRQKWAAQRDARRNATHAREAYGVPGQSVDALPPRMVFDR